jgi:hypothetical protein
MSEVKKIIDSLNLDLPEIAKPVAAYIPAK